MVVREVTVRRFGEHCAKDTRPLIRRSVRSLAKLTIQPWGSQAVRWRASVLPRLLTRSRFKGKRRAHSGPRATNMLKDAITVDGALCVFLQ